MVKDALRILECRQQIISKDTPSRSIHFYAFRMLFTTQNTIKIEKNFSRFTDSL